jgi:ABC-type transport system involved in multi-copper enzyme maturation permease subunit
VSTPGASATTPPAAGFAFRGRITQARVAHSEWTKLVTLRSTLWSLGVGIFLTIAFPALFALVTASHWSHMTPSQQADRHPLDIAYAGVDIAQLAVAILGVLVITGEYSTGMIRSTLIAVPKRLPVLWAKLGVYAVVSFLLILPSVLIAFFASQAILKSHHILQISFGAPGVARTAVGAALYVTLVGIFALGIGAIVRNTAGGIAAFAGIFFVLPPLMEVLPTNWNNAISQYLPGNAGRQLFSLHNADHSLTPLAGGLLMVAYCVAAVAIAAVLLVRRDA